MFEKVPEELKNLRQWVNWKLVTKANDKPTKVPVSFTGKAASSTNPESWGGFKEAVEYSNKFDGIGFVFSKDDDLCGIDFDACRNPQDGSIAEWAKEWIKKLDSYSEISPSGTGLKVWIKGKIPLESGKKALLPQHKVGNKTPAIEAYDHGRYFCVTGLRYDQLAHDPQPRQDVLNALCLEFFKPEVQSSTTANTRLSVIERARKYLDTIPGAVSGSGGHDQTFKAACSLILGFSLTKTESLILMSEYNQRCEPKWSEKDLQHKINSADKQAGERGYLRDSKDEDWKTVKTPEYHEQNKPIDLKPSEPTVITLEASVEKYITKITTTNDRLLNIGISHVDAAIGGGVENHEMVLVCARPSHGKSSFCLQALDAAAFMGHPCAMISQEMSSIALGKRTLQFASEIPQQEWLTRLDDVREGLKTHFSTRAPVYVVEGCGSIQRACDSLKKLHDTKGVTVAAVDYAQVMTAKGNNRYEQITQVSMMLRELANSTNMTIYVLCQLSRNIETREKFIPLLSDIKESGQLEQDADVILFLVWPWKVDENKAQDFYQVFVGKNRNRPILKSVVDCRFNPARQMIMAPKVRWEERKIQQERLYDD